MDGWFTTEDQGDVSYSCLHVLGRHKDYIKIGGEGTNVARLRSLLENCALQLNPSWPLHMVLLEMPSDRLGHEIHLVSTMPATESEKVVQLYSEKVLPFEKNS